MYLAVNLVSFLTVKKIENLSIIDKVTVCNAMSSFLDHFNRFDVRFVVSGGT